MSLKLNPQPSTRGYFFDFHIDAKPDDSLQRSVNVNVMLSPREDYEGGGLQVVFQKKCITVHYDIFIIVVESRR